MTSIYPDLKANTHLNGSYIDTEQSRTSQTNLNYVNVERQNQQAPFVMPVQPDATIPPPNVLQPSVEYATVAPTVKRVKTSSKRSTCCTSCIIIAVILVILIMLGILAILILYGLVPCKFVTCHINAKCINYAFNPTCVCNYGYAGNGRSRCDECGIRFKQPNVRIIGGQFSTQSSWPEAAYILFSYKAKVKDGKETKIISHSSFCGGSLINHNYVLTAAHCIPNKIKYDSPTSGSISVTVTPNEDYPTLESMFSVYLGVYNRSWTSKTFSEQQFNVKKVKKHESYNSNSLVNDIALLQLDKIVSMNENVQMACLPETISSEYPDTNSNAYIIGWGSTDSKATTDTSSYYLKNGKIKVFPEKDCLSVAMSYQKIWNAQICAGDKNGKIDTCSGDSGGGLFVEDKINNASKLILAGVTSYGDGCAKPSMPGIYTRVSYYLDWIQKNYGF